MEAIVPYLNFNGNAAEALDFYAKALNGAILFKQSFGESPMPHTADMKDKIMHATFQADKLTLMVSDCPPQMEATAGTNVSLSLNFHDIGSIEKTFAAFSEGAKITMELQDTFWGARFGMLTDKFGINWMFNHDKTPADK
ncbi:MAG: VOC family protein [Ferruginibacter sp.]